MRVIFEQLIAFGLTFIIVTVGPPSLEIAQATGNTGLQSQDDSATSTDQAAKPAEPKSGTTLIGCLSGPDSEGKFTLRSMSHRTGVEVFGPIELEGRFGQQGEAHGLLEAPRRSPP